MLKVACLPSHPLEKLVARKKRRGSEAVYEAKLLPFRRKTDSARRYFDSKVRRNGTTGESSAVHTWAKTTDFLEAEHEPIYAIPGSY
ncbi:UNVERIFIED_CONTAM: hypothetical protein Scaly_3051100 [Sesamum calycinum]|uniref:Uncharacterized protein n=1 Tax=Sesamum calycinum TaxID=2727403 RepID=A0AAW2K1C7_9LAMI